MTARKKSINYEGMRRLYLGDFNTMSQEIVSATVVAIELSREGETKRYRMEVKNLYRENEEVLTYEEIDTKTADHVLQRMREAKEYGKRAKG